MSNLYPRYKDVSDWTVLDKKTIHMYDEFETPVEVVQVEIGTLSSIDSYTMHISPIGPITRWLSKKEYDYLRANEGTIIW